MNTWGDSFSSSSSRMTSTTSPRPSSSRQAITISNESGVLCEEPNQSLRRRTEGFKLSPNSSILTSLYPRRFPSALQSRPSSPPSSSFATLRSQVGGGGPEYIGERGSRGDVAPLG